MHPNARYKRGVIDLYWSVAITYLRKKQHIFLLYQYTLAKFAWKKNGLKSILFLKSSWPSFMLLKKINRVRTFSYLLLKVFLLLLLLCEKTIKFTASHLSCDGCFMHREIHLQMNFSEQAVLTESLQTQILVVLLQLHVFLPLSSTLGYVTHVSLCGYDRLSPGGPLQLCHQSHFMDFSLCYSTLGKRVQDVNWRQHSCMNLLTWRAPPICSYSTFWHLAFGNRNVLFIQEVWLRFRIQRRVLLQCHQICTGFVFNVWLEV